MKNDNPPLERCYHGKLIKEVVWNFKEFGITDYLLERFPWYSTHGFFESRLLNKILVKKSFSFIIPCYLSRL